MCLHYDISRWQTNVNDPTENFTLVSILQSLCLTLFNFINYTSASRDVPRININNIITIMLNLIAPSKSTIEKLYGSKCSYGEGV